MAARQVFTTPRARASARRAVTARAVPRPHVAAVPEGTYNRLAGGTSLEASCKECPLGKFCGLGTTVPTFCPAGTVDRANAVGAGGPDSCECQPGFYLADAMPDVADWACKRCPSNAACDSTTRLSMLSIEPGYWRLSNETDDLHRCRENAEGWSPCLGGASGGDASCTIGHHGPLCQLCQPEHYFSRPDAACRACGDVTASILKIAALLALCAVVVGAFRALVLSRWIPEHRRRESSWLTSAASTWCGVSVECKPSSRS